MLHVSCCTFVLLLSVCGGFGGGRGGGNLSSKSLFCLGNSMTIKFGEHSEFDCPKFCCRHLKFGSPKYSGASFRRGDFAPREPEFGVEFWDANF